MTDQDKTPAAEPKATELEEQDLDRAVGGRLASARPRRTACPCDGGE